MKLNTTGSILGGLIGAGALVPLGLFAPDLGLVVPAIMAGVVLLGYVLAAATVNGASKFSEFCRGFLIGFNALANGFIVYWLFAGLSVPAAIGIGASLGLVNLLSVIPLLTRTEGWQGVLGWLNLFLPMSWPIVAIGITFVVVSFLLALVTGWKVPFLALRQGRVDWSTGTFFVKGGLIANLNAWDTAFNMGNFAFVDHRSSGWHIDHEAGHTLNLAAFGAIFHLVGAFDEIVLRRGHRAYAERMAESNDSGTAGSNISIWA